MAVIDQSVVTIRPDFTGFRAALKAGLKKASAGLSIKIPVEIEGGKGTGSPIVKAARAARKGVAEAQKDTIRDTKALGLQYLRAKVEQNKAIAAANSDRVKNEEKAAKQQAAAFARVAAENQRSARADRRNRRIEQAEQLREQEAHFAEAIRMNRQFDREEDSRHAEALRRNQAFDRERATGIAQTAAENRRSRIADLREQRRADQEAIRSTRERERATRASGKGLLAALAPPRLINLGGEGIKPMNLLYASLLALVPVLVSVASSAAQAGTSIVALGSAAYGGALAVTGLTVAFSGVLGALKLHQSLQKAQQGQAVKSAKAETRNSGAIRNAADAAISAKEGIADAAERLRDAQRDEKKSITEVAQAYKDAAQKVKDLRLELQDLRVQQSGNNLDVEEAQRKLREVNANFFATDLQRREAAQALLEARQRGRDIAGDISKTGGELKQRTKLGASPEVVAAREAARRATQDRVQAQRSLARATRSAADAQRDYTDALNGTNAATATTLAQDGQLQAALKDLSPAARDLYEWALANTEQFKKFRRSIEQAILPGFLKFLKSVTARSTGKSIVDVLVDGITAIGVEMSETATQMGRFIRSPFFRGSLVKLNKDNAESFRNLGDAARAFARPFTRLIVAASPLIVRVTRNINELANSFSSWIDTFSDEDLAGWFSRAGDELAKWWKIASNLGSTLLSIFRASLPSGQGLVGKIQELTGRLAEWAKSTRGQDKIREFFKTFANLPYDKIARAAASLAALAATFLAGKFAAKNIGTTFFAIFTAKYPDATLVFLEGVTKATITLLSFLESHPETVMTFMALMGVYKAGKTFKPIGDLLSRVPGVGKLFGDLGATRTNPMYVSVVNGFGGGGGGGGGGDNTFFGDGDGKDKDKKGGKPKGGKPRRGLPKRGLPKIGPGGLAFGAAIAADVGLSMLPEPKSNALTDLKMGAQWALTAGSWTAFFGPEVAVPAALLAGLAGTIVSASGRPGAKGTNNWQPTHTVAEATPGESGNMGPAGSMGAMSRAQRRRRIQTMLDVTRGTMLGQRAAKIKDEGTAFKILQEFVADDVQKDTLLTPAKAQANKPLQDYIKARQDAVIANHNYMRSVAGSQMADANAMAQTTKSRAELSKLLQQYNWTKEDADAYAASVFKLTDVIKDGGGIIGDTTTVVDKFGREAVITTTAVDALNTKLGVLKEKTDLATGQKTLSLVVDGEDKVFDTMKDLVVYQAGLQKGDVSPSALAEQRRLYDKQNIGAARGGLIPGFSPHDRADNIPAMLTAKEYVQPVDAVKHYGTAFMDAVRTKKYPRETFEGYAKGGLVSDQWPFPVDVSKTMIPQSPLLTGGVVTGDAEVARIAEATARAMGANEKQLIALFEAGLVESGMRNLPYGDRDSIGYLQQRPSQGWGTRKQIMDVSYATRKFITKAKKVDNRKFDAGRLAQAVQVSAFPDLYSQRYADAIAILNVAPPYVGGGPGLSGAGGGTRAALIDFGRWLQQRGYDVSENPAFGGVHGGHVPGSQHYRGNAIDVNHGAGTSRREQRFLAAIIPEGHRRGLRSLFMVPGHYNHAHFDLGPGHFKGGMVQTFDEGGKLKPGVTIAVNRTGQDETILSPSQERALGPVQLPNRSEFRRIDRRDLSLLANYIAFAVAGQTISMDGRKVAETVRSYDYLPKGI